MAPLGLVGWLFLVGRSSVGSVAAATTTAKERAAASYVIARGAARIGPPKISVTVAVTKFHQGVHKLCVIPHPDGTVPRKMQYCLGRDSELLIAACRLGDVACVRGLLTNGADPSAEMRSSTHLAAPDKTALLLAVMQGHAECAQLLIDAGARLDVVCGPDLETALHVSCARGTAAIAEQLIAGGANLSKTDVIGRSPLFLSCLFDRPECTATMIAAIRAIGGNDLHTVVACTTTPGLSGVPLIEQPMAGHNPGATPLYAAACNGSLGCAALLCKAGATIDARTQNDASPLLVSCQNGHLGVAMLLSSYGAPRVVICTKFPGTAPASSDAEALAEEGGHTALLRWLVESRRYTPLHHVQALTVERASGLLRAGYSPLARHQGLSRAAPSGVSDSSCAYRASSRSSGLQDSSGSRLSAGRSPARKAQHCLRRRQCCCSATQRGGGAPCQGRTR